MLHQVYTEAPTAEGYYWFTGEYTTSWGSVEKWDEPVWISEFEEVYTFNHEESVPLEAFSGEWQLLKEGS